MPASTCHRQPRSGDPLAVIRQPATGNRDPATGNRDPVIRWP